MQRVRDLLERDLIEGDFIKRDLIQSDLPVQSEYLLSDNFEQNQVASAKHEVLERQISSLAASVLSGNNSDLNLNNHSNGDLLEIWSNVQNGLKKRLDPQIYAAWISQLKLGSINNGVSGDNDVSGSPKTCVATLITPNKFCFEHVSKHYGSLISDLLSAKLGKPNIELSFSVSKQTVGSSKTTSGSSLSTAVTRERVSPQRKSSKSSEVGSSNLNPKYNFSNYVVGACNQFAHAVSLQVANDLGGQYNPLFIYGGVGLGKTHLANAIGNASIRRNKKVLLASSESFLSELISSLRSNTMSQFKSKFRSLDLLIVDDIQFIIGKERTQEEFFHTFNELYNRHKQIIITSDKVPQELVGLEERLRTRFSSGIAVDLQKPDFETRVAILIKKAQVANLSLSSQVAGMMAERIDTNVRELEGAFNRLQALSVMRDSAPDEQMADEVVRSLAPQRKRDITTDLVKRIVAEKFNVSVHDIVGKRRTHNIALARQVAMYFCRELTPCSYPELGALFGGRDHSTVIHARKVISEKLERDESFRAEIRSIESSINS